MQGLKKRTQTHEHTHYRNQVTNWIIQHYATKGDRVSQRYRHTSHVPASVAVPTQSGDKRRGKKKKQKTEVCVCVFTETRHCRRLKQAPLDKFKMKTLVIVSGMGKVAAACYGFSKSERLTFAGCCIERFRGHEMHLTEERRHR